jgi:hypothetical protein
VSWSPRKPDKLALGEKPFENLDFFWIVRRFLQIHSEARHSNRTNTCQGLSELVRGAVLKFSSHI